MADDNNKIGPGGGAEDPWAGIDADATPAAGDSFEFPGFESLGDEPAAVESSSPMVDERGDEPAIDVPSADAESSNAPTFDAPTFEAPTFDALSLGAQDGVFSDEAAWGKDEGSWAAEDSPLAVFPPADAVASPSGDLVPSGDERPDEAPSVDPLLFGHSDASGDLGGDSDALAHLEDAGDLEAEGGVVAFASPETAGDGEAVPLAVDDSLFAGENMSGDGESLVGQSQIGGSAIQIGTGQSGILPFEDWAESPDAAATDASADASDGENPFDGASFGDVGFDGLAEEGGITAGGVDGGHAEGVFAEGAAVAAAAGGAVAASKAAPVRRVVKKRSSGSGVAAMISVLLGGVLSIPIVIGLLFWVFKKDPFHIAAKIPTSLSFLLPAEFQVGTRGRTLPGLAGRGDTLVASRSLEDLVTDGAGNDAAGDGAAPADAQEDPATDQPAETAAEPRGDAGENLFGGATEPVADVSKKPPPLDTSALDDAVTVAEEATGRLLATEDDDPGYKRLLKEWYTALAKVGDETVSLEQKSAESGGEFDATSPAVERTIGRILADERANAQFVKLSRMWLKSRGRSSDGVVLPAVMGSSRKVGAWWVSRVRVSDDPAVPEVAILSRSQPEASEGDAVVVLGLVFEPGVVWAAVCGRFEPVGVAEPVEDAAKDEPPATPARGDDLFPLE